MFRWCWWNRSPGYAPKLLAYYQISQSILYSQDYSSNGCSGRANGCEKSAKCAAGGDSQLGSTPGVGGWLGSYPKGTSGCIWYGLALKMASFGIFVGEASKSRVWRRAAEGGSNWAEAGGMRGRSALRNSPGRGSSTKYGGAK